MKTRTFLGLKRIMAFLVVFGYLFSATVSAQTLGGIPASIQTPRDIANWLASDFQYQMKMPDKPQSPRETLANKTGDCDDFAALASSALSGMGIKSHLLIIKFRGLNVRHAICIWVGANGKVSYIDTKRLVNTRATSVMAAVSKYFPDWHEVTFSNINRETLRVVRNS